MAEIYFDNRGYLQPEGVTELSLSDLKRLFVEQFEASETRELIFEDYQHYVEDLFELVKVGFTQWIDGSFISLKPNPKDLDFVTFIDFEVYSQLENEIDERFSKWSVRDHYSKLEAFTIWEYPEKHKFYNTFKADQTYWYNWFGRSRYNRAKKRFYKGFIQIKFDATWNKRWD